MHLKFSNSTLFLLLLVLHVLQIQDLAMALLFGIGYAGIIFEESLALNKSGIGLLMAVSLWVIRSIGVIFMFYVEK